MRSLLFVVGLMVLPGLAAAQPPARPAAPSGGATLDFEYFRTRVQPIFLAKRPGHARCITCHKNGTPRLVDLAPGQTMWDEAQSRQNFEAWQRVVVPGDPEASRLLMHPLAKAAGGDVFHAGGRHWQSKAHPEWQTLAAWVRTAGSTAMTTQGGVFDFEAYRTRIEPIFLQERAADEGAGRCVACHAYNATRLRLQPLSPGSAAWTIEQSRQNFEAVTRVVVAGDPDASRLAMHPLAQAAGGDAQHTGGKFWPSKDHPEYRAVAAWIRSASASPGNRAASAAGAGDRATPAAATAPALDFEFFKARVEPIFLAKRPGHARCVTCHKNGTPRLQELPAGQAAWTDAQSRQNFDAWQRVVVPGDPDASRLLMHPLAKAAGGDVFHAGGRHWQSKADPEWQTLAAWVRGERAAGAAGSR